MHVQFAFEEKHNVVGKMNRTPSAMIGVSYVGHHVDERTELNKSSMHSLRNGREFDVAVWGIDIERRGDRGFALECRDKNQDRLLDKYRCPLMSGAEMKRWPRETSIELALRHRFNPMTCSASMCKKFAGRERLTAPRSGCQGARRSGVCDGRHGFEVVSSSWYLPHLK